MIDLMDKALVALQAAATARKLYGPAHPSVGRQLALAAETLGLLLAGRRELRVVRLDGALLFEDADLPSCAVLSAALVPALAKHGVEWVELRQGLEQPELLTFLDQLERPPARHSDAGAGLPDRQRLERERLLRPRVRRQAAQSQRDRRRRQAPRADEGS